MQNAEGGRVVAWRAHLWFLGVLRRITSGRQSPHVRLLYKHTFSGVGAGRVDKRFAPYVHFGVGKLQLSENQSDEEHDSHENERDPERGEQALLPELFMTLSEQRLELLDSFRELLGCGVVGDQVGDLPVGLPGVVAGLFSDLHGSQGAV